jgi:hypothetical protein
MPVTCYPLASDHSQHPDAVLIVAGDTTGTPTVPRQTVKTKAAAVPWLWGLLPSNGPSMRC